MSTNRQPINASGRFKIVAVSHVRYHLRDAFDADDLQAALREFFHRFLSSKPLHLSMNSHVLRDGETGKRYSLREASELFPGLPWHWWCRGCEAEMLKFVQGGAV